MKYACYKKESWGETRLGYVRAKDDNKAMEKAKKMWPGLVYKVRKAPTK